MIAAARRAAGVCALLAALAALAAPAMAHSLRVFVTVEGQMVRGYGFFVGGGRPDGADWRAEAGDRTLATGTTDGDGGFGFVLPGPVAEDIVVTIDPGDGHAAQATLAPARVGQQAAPPRPLPDAPGTAADAPPPSGRTGAAAPPGFPDPAALETAIEAAVDRAVARQVEPLLIRLEEMDARLRLTDLVSGGLAIFGLAGAALWLRGRGR